MPESMPCFIDLVNSNSRVLSEHCRPFPLKFIDINSFPNNYQKVAEESKVFLVYLSTLDENIISHIDDINKKIRKMHSMMIIVLSESLFSEHERLLELADQQDFVFVMEERDWSIGRLTKKLLGVNSELQKLKDKQNDLKKAARSAMLSSAQIGSILNMLEKSSGLSRKEEMVEIVFSCLRCLDLECSFLFSSAYNEYDYYFTEDRRFRPKEKRLMTAFRSYCRANPEQNRFKTFNSRLMVAGKYITLLIRAIPASDEAQGEIRDVLGAFINAADALAAQVERYTLEARQGDLIKKAINQSTHTVATLEGMFNAHESKIMTIMNTLMINTQEGLSILGLTEEQENYFIQLLDSSMAELVEMYGSGIAIEDLFKGIIKYMEKIGVTGSRDVV